MSKKIFLFLFFIVASTKFIYAQYYTPALGLNGAALKTSLHNIIKNHTAVLYSDLWTSFQTTDAKPNGQVWDMYTDIPGGIPVYIYQFGINQCGNYSAEGDCYNREHSWPKEYFGGDNAYPMYSDLHHLFATDGWVNNKHAAFPLGKINGSSYTSSNGTKLGTGTSYSGYSDKLFEPIDNYKGDFARAYFYMSTRYEGEDAGWQNWTMANGATLTPDAITLLLQWHHNDPVSQKEIDRNEAVFLIQGNRNPFIDYPQFADCIWSIGDCTSLSVSENNFSNSISIFPNPSNQLIELQSQSSDIILQEITVMDIVGKSYPIQFSTSNFQHTRINIQALNNGNYILQLKTNKGIINKLFSKN